MYVERSLDSNDALPRHASRPGRLCNPADEFDAGVQVLQLLEQQWSVQDGSGSLLQVSKGFSYTWDANRPVGQRVVPGSVRLMGQALAAAGSYRVTVNAYMADGGGRLAVFKEGRDARTGLMGVDALEQYVKNNPALGPGPLDRIVRLN